MYISASDKAVSSVLAKEELIERNSNNKGRSLNIIIPGCLLYLQVYLSIPLSKQALAIAANLSNPHTYLDIAG